MEQAADKLEKATGLKCATEKAEQTSLGSWYRVVVGSVQTLMRESRLERFQKTFSTQSSLMKPITAYQIVTSVY